MIFGPCSLDAVVRESQMGRHFSGSISLRLLGFDWVQCVDMGERAIIRVQLPQDANEAGRPSDGFELEAILSGFCKMNFSGRGGDSSPAEMIGSAERSELRERTGRIFGNG